MLTPEDVYAVEDNDGDLDRIVEHYEDQNLEDENVEEIERQKNDSEEESNATAAKPKRVVRNPLPKLNADTLKAPKGIHTLPNLFTNVDFKGSGHEEEDLNLLMKSYEYWCHRLFPKLPFDDCLEKIETLGHKKSVQTHLKKIRMDMLMDDISNDVQSDHDREAEEIVNVSQTLPNIATEHDEPQELTEEQLERIRLNKERAMRIRMERLQKANSNTPAGNINSHNLIMDNGNISIRDDAQAVDVMVNIREEHIGKSVELDVPAEHSGAAINEVFGSSDCDIESVRFNRYKSKNKPTTRLIESSDEEQFETVLRYPVLGSEECTTDIFRVSDVVPNSDKMESCTSKENSSFQVNEETTIAANSPKPNSDEEEMDIDNILQTVQKENESSTDR